MCGSNQSKEPQEVIIAQTAAGGSNSATVEQLKFYIGLMSVFMGAMCFLLCCGFCYMMASYYRKCHKRMIRREFHGMDVQRTLQRRERGAKAAVEEV